MFITTNMNHWRAVKAWLDANGGRAMLDMATHELEVRARNRYYVLHPQFRAEAAGRMMHVSALTAQATAFIGWRPYKPLQLRLSSDKLAFKAAMNEARLRTPAWWGRAEDARADFVLKRSAGSFGYELAGPFRAGQLPSEALLSRLEGPGQRGTLYAEAFVVGRNVKAWFWDGEPVHLQCQPYAQVEGDGVSSVRALVDDRMRGAGGSWDRIEEREVLLGCLAYQGVVPSTVLTKGQTVWLDYRYGRGFLASPVTEREDNAWWRLDDGAKSQVKAVGAHLAADIRREVRAPLLFSVDGVLDEQGAIWWLELNSNPICPPNAYFAMFATLFDTPAKAPPNAFSQATRAAPSRPKGSASSSAKTVSGVA